MEVKCPNQNYLNQGHCMTTVCLLGSRAFQRDSLAVKTMVQIYYCNHFYLLYIFVTLLQKGGTLR